MEASHAKQNSEHYKLLRDHPGYRAEFILDVMKEQFNNEMPYYMPTPKQFNSEPVFRPRPVHKEIDQLKAQILHLQDKVVELSKSKPKGKKGGDLY